MFLELWKNRAEKISIFKKKPLKILNEDIILIVLALNISEC